MAKRKQLPAPPASGHDAPASPARPDAAVTVAATPLAAQAEATVASPGAQVATLHAEHLVLRAMIQCRPGMARGTRSELWTKMGVGKVYEAARLYLIEHLPAAKVHARLRLPKGSERALDRILDNIQDAHTKLLIEELERQAQAQAMLAVGGGEDIAGQVQLMTGLLIRRMAPVIARLDWDEMEAGDRNNVMRLMEMLTDASKNFADAQHKAAQTERLRKIILDEVEAAEGKGEHVLDTSRVRNLLAEHMGLKAQPSPAPATPAGTEATPA